MQPRIALTGLAATLLDLAVAHGYVSSIEVGGTVTLGSNPNWYYLPEEPQTAGWDALNQDNGFVEPNSFGTADINCHKSATPGALFVEANAGDDITFVWNTWPDSHKGPVINYISTYADSPTALSWAKFSEDGLISGDTWATDELIQNGFSYTTTIPATLAPGDYVIRHEIIALHSAGQANGAQAYPQCVNVRIGSGGSATPTGVAGTSLYTATDPGILFDLYSGYDSYPIPGPALWSA